MSPSGPTIPVTGNIEIELSETVTQPLKYDQRSSFEQLGQTQRERVERALRTLFSNEVLDKHWQDLKYWKVPVEHDIDSSHLPTRRALYHQAREEFLVKNALADQCSLNNCEPRKQFDFDLAENDQLFMLTIYYLSKNIADYIISDSPEESTVTLYRALNYEAPAIAADAIDNPSKDSFMLPTSVLSNYTLTKSHAAGYGPLVLKQEVDIEEVIVAADYFVEYPPDVSANNKLTRDAECRVAGGLSEEVSAYNLEVVCKQVNDNGSFKRGTPVQDSFSVNGFFNDLPTKGEIGFWTAVKMVQKLQTRINKEKNKPSGNPGRYQVKSDDGKQRLERWLENVKPDVDNEEWKDYRNWVRTVMN